MCDLKTYLNNPLTFAKGCAKREFGLEKSAAFLSGCEFFCKKMADIRAIAKEIGENEYFGGLRVRFPLTVKRKAFMNDDGRVFFSVGLICRTKRATLLSVIWHELSHIYLSKQQFYPQLKELNREFKQKFTINTAYLLSPIEVTAMALSIEILEKLSKNHDCGGVLTAVIDEERGKLSVLLDELSRLTERE